MAGTGQKPHNSPFRAAPPCADNAHYVKLPFSQVPPPRHGVLSHPSWPNLNRADRGEGSVSSSWPAPSIQSQPSWPVSRCLNLVGQSGGFSVSVLLASFPLSRSTWPIWRVLNWELCLAHSGRRNPRGAGARVRAALAVNLAARAADPEEALSMTVDYVRKSLTLHNLSYRSYRAYRT